jgi:hypothetical protein
MKAKNKKRILISLTIFIFLFLFSIITISEAQALEFKPQVGIPSSEFQYGNTVNLEGKSGTYYIARFVSAIYDYGVSVGAILAAIMLMAGGLIWLTSGGSQEKIGKAKDIIAGSVIGLFLLLGAYTILNMVNPKLVNLNTPIIEGIDKVVMCCHQTRGLVPETEALEGDGFECPHNSEICTGDTTCQPNSEASARIGSNTIPWQCINEKNYKCCEYSDKINIQCRTISQNEICDPNMIFSHTLKNTYHNTQCDKDGDGRIPLLGGKCHYPGPKKCCECQSRGLHYGLGVAYLDRACRDYYSYEECEYWCYEPLVLLWKINLTEGTCQTDGRCQ